MTFEVVLLIGYLVHLIASVGLLFNIWYNQHYKGLSVESQILYTLVFTTRHLDLFTQCPLNAETAFKVAFTTMTWGTLLSMIVFRKTYQKKYDALRHIHPSASYYVDAVGVSKALDSVYWSRRYYYGKENLNLSVAANMVQLVFFCGFFFRMIIFGVCCRKNKISRAVVATTQTDVENGISETGHLVSNVSTVLLRPRVSNEDGNNRVALSGLEMFI